jgi:hypothetical protein
MFSVTVNAKFVNVLEIHVPTLQPCDDARPWLHIVIYDEAAENAKDLTNLERKFFVLSSAHPSLHVHSTYKIP